MPVTKPTSPVKASTQTFIEIEDIKDDVLLLKDFSAAIVIEVGAVNFWLLSSEEQTSTIYAYASLINSLSFPVQILILSKKMDISSYLEYLDGKMAQKKKTSCARVLPSIKILLKVSSRRIRFLKKILLCGAIFPFGDGGFGFRVGNEKEYVIARAKTALYPKRDHLLRLLAKIGLRATVMQKQELTELFYNLYNPSATGRMLAPVESYTDVIMTSI